MSEVFKPINGYESEYSISNYGQVKRFYLNGKTKILKSKSIKGYNQITLCKNNIKKYYLVHRLVAEHFIENPLNKPQIDHIDMNKNNNKFDNLRWVTCKENKVNQKSKSNCGKKYISILKSNKKKKYHLRIKGLISKLFYSLEEALLERAYLIDTHNILFKEIYDTS